MLVASLAALLAASPLSVRVLEKEHPVRARLAGASLTCDGRALPDAVELQVAAREVRAGPELCSELVAAGPITLAVNDLTREYPGTMHVVLEGGFLRFVVDVEVEAYLPSVVASEMSGTAAGALEAQAIVSRTFALSGPRHEQAGYQLCDLAHCQLYRGRTEETAEARAAVARTKGQVLLVGGVGLKPAFFHSACGGHTSRAQDVFHEEGAGPGVSDVEKGGAALCADAPDFAWEWSVDRMELARGLGLNGKPDVAAFESLRRDVGGRVLELKSFGKRYAGNEYLAAIGRAFGWQTLRSLKVTAKEVDRQITFTGTGLGHGVGLCQQGARTLAAKGADGKAILKRYFPDCQVRVHEP